MKSVVINLLKIKSLVTIIVISVFAYLSITGKVPIEAVITITSSVMSFYFGTHHERQIANPQRRIQDGVDKSE